MMNETRTPGPYSAGWDYDENGGCFILAQDGAGVLGIAEALYNDPARVDDDIEADELPASANMDYIVLAMNHFPTLLAVCEAHLAARAEAMTGKVSNDLGARLIQIGRDMEAAVKAVKAAE